MDAIDRSHSFGLHVAAIAGDDEGVRRALEAGADVNSLYRDGRTAVTCAVAGEDWQQNIDASNASHMTPGRLRALQLLVEHPGTSLFTLNAPQRAMNGVTALGVAAWLNLPEAVTILLDGSIETVLVDAMDSHGATALMYAARDGHLEVTQLLLDHGARPDFRDINHRTSIQFALPYPQILWLCESVLRRHRWRESISDGRRKLPSDSERLLELAEFSLPPSSVFDLPPASIFAPAATSKLTDTLVQAIMSSDLSFVNSLLFSPPPPTCSPPDLYPMSAPVLVNQPDSTGWSPIHHCVSVEHPSIDVLDALYCAGADVSIFTAHEQFTPLHCLALSARSFDHDSEAALSLYHFTVHLIHDLRAPLSARDSDEETCIHVAAEHGLCIDILMIFLEHDVTGVVRELRNARGLTALEVAKPEFRVAFGEHAEKLRSVSSLSVRTIRPAASFASMISFSEWNAAGDGAAVVGDNTPLLTDFDISTSSRQLLANLRITSPDLFDPRTDTPSSLRNILADTNRIGRVVFNHYKDRTQEAARDLQYAQSACEKVTLLLDYVALSVEKKLAEQGLRPCYPGKCNRESEDSETTAVSSKSGAEGVSKKGTSTPDAFVNSERYEGYSDISRSAEALVPDIAERGLSPWPEWFDSLVSERCGNSSRSEKSAEKALKKPSHTNKLKSWLRKIIPGREAVSVPKDLDDSLFISIPVASKTYPEALESVDEVDNVDRALQHAHVVLDAARRDLLDIHRCLLTAEQLITVSSHSASRANRILKRAITYRESAIGTLHPDDSLNDVQHVSRFSPSPQPHSYSNYLTSQPSIESMASARSGASSRGSVSETLKNHEDEDVRALRRFLLRKIDSKIEGAFSEIDKATNWLRIVKEVARGVKRRAYL